MRNAESIACRDELARIPESYSRGHRFQIADENEKKAGRGHDPVFFFIHEIIAGAE
jgi:hypothetical protein